VERVISVAAIDQEFRSRGQTLFVDTDGQLMAFGRESLRKGLPNLLTG
jgi:archaeosine-15-forming tRNA-guanine transglycosylase